MVDHRGGALVANHGYGWLSYPVGCTMIPKGNMDRPTLWPYPSPDFS